MSCSLRLFILALLTVLATGCNLQRVSGAAVDELGVVQDETPEHDLLDPVLAAGVLALINDVEVDAEFLDVGLELDSRVATRIVAHRQGPDGVDGTEDDDLFDDLWELDDVAYVGESTILRLAHWAVELGYVEGEEA